MTGAEPDVQRLTLRVLHLEDSGLDAELVGDSLSLTGLAYELDRVVAREDFLEAIGGSPYDLILADYALPAFDGMSALAMVRERCPNTPFVFVSGTLGEEVAVEALKRGATDYVVKQRLDRLPGTVVRALAEARERSERQKAERALRELVDEKTTLLNELDHRVKNNLQLLLALVSFELRRHRPGEVREALERVREPLQALAAVHRQLHSGAGVGTFDAAAFARDLGEDLVAAAGRADIRPEFHLEPVHVSAAKAGALALVMNELVSNALVHGYAGREGMVRLSLREKEGGCVFELGDCRFTAAEKAATRKTSGSAIFRALTQQLGAAVEWPDTEPAVLFRLAFPTGHDPRRS